MKKFTIETLYKWVIVSAYVTVSLTGLMLTFNPKLPLGLRVLCFLLAVASLGLLRQELKNTIRPW